VASSRLGDEGESGRHSLVAAADRSRSTAYSHSHACRELLTEPVQPVAVLFDHLVGLPLERSDVRRRRIVHVVAAHVELGLEAVVARISLIAVATEDPHLMVDRVTDAVEDDVQDWLGPQRKPPTLCFVVADRPRELSGTQ
jgi:hypothetical protein